MSVIIPDFLPCLPAIYRNFIVDRQQAIWIERAGEKSLVITSMDSDTFVRTVERVGRIGG